VIERLFTAIAYLRIYVLSNLIFAPLFHQLFRCCGQTEEGCYGLVLLARVAEGTDMPVWHEGSGVGRGGSVNVVLFLFIHYHYHLTEQLYIFSINSLY